MKKNELTLRKLNNTTFPKVYEEFLLKKNENRGCYVRMLALATLFLNSTDDKIKHLGYRIIVMYCNRVKDYKPLYDIAINQGLIPIAQYIQKYIISDKDSNFFTEMNYAVNEGFLINNVYCSLQQKELIEFFENNTDDTVSVVAPTSYGKTDLIVSTMKKAIDKNVCVLTPTKSLLAQTKMRVSQEGIPNRKKIITHPEMYNDSDKNINAILTQERLLRLLRKKEDISFDYVIVDEAHGLLHDDKRNTLLANVILLLEKRNPNTIFKFLTPFVCDASNMKVRYADYTIKTYQVDEYIKTEKIYLADFRKGKEKYFLYDQFMNEFYKLDMPAEELKEWLFIKKVSSKKNIIYLNKPKDIEDFAEEILNDAETHVTKEVKEVCKNIAEYVHPKYRLIDCIKHGVVYHHGAVPEPIRMYVEKIYAEMEIIKYVITSSTLLEGVNLPAEKMFILDNKKGRSRLSPSDFKNLIGRVCRFSQIFHPNNGSLQRLEPSIYLLAGKYCSSNANYETFIKETMNVGKEIKDDLKNVMLDNTPINGENVEKLEKAEEFIENYEPGTIDNYDLRITNTEIGKSCFLNNVFEMDVFTHEQVMQHEVDRVKESQPKISDVTQLFRTLYSIFFTKIDDDKIKRFYHVETRNFYSMFLKWRISNTSLNQMISSFMRYWKTLIADPQKEKVIFVGRWGDMIRNGVIPLWTDISKKTDSELVNLAIVRIKEEQDFLDNVIIKYIEVLYEMELIEENFYLLIKYGTDDKRIITCTKNGISLSLAKILVNKYIDFIQIDTDNDTIRFRDNIVDAMEQAKENKILICELQYFL